MSATGVHLLLSAGRGPVECAWALAQLLHRMETDAITHHLTTRRLQTVSGDRPGTYRSVLIRITGEGAAGFAASWIGTLCWQAPSPYRTGHGRKNWYVTAQPCTLDVPQAAFVESDVDIVACRTGGPGGQHRNKASTAVRATHRPTGRRPHPRRTPHRRRDTIRPAETITPPHACRPCVGRPGNTIGQQIRCRSPEATVRWWQHDGDRG